MILVLLIYSLVLSFLQTEYGITFDEALESTRQLCTLIENFKGQEKRRGLRS